MVIVYSLHIQLLDAWLASYPIHAILCLISGIRIEGEHVHLVFHFLIALSQEYLRNIGRENGFSI